MFCFGAACPLLAPELYKTERGGLNAPSNYILLVLFPLVAHPPSFPSPCLALLSPAPPSPRLAFFQQHATTCSAGPHPHRPRSGWLSFRYHGPIQFGTNVPSIPSLRMYVLVRSDHIDFTFRAPCLRSALPLTSGSCPILKIPSYTLGFSEERSSAVPGEAGRLTCP
jgi:hypothetical protein